MNQFVERAVSSTARPARCMTESFVRTLRMPDLNDTAPCTRRSDMCWEPGVINHRHTRALQCPRCTDQVEEIGDLCGKAVTVRSELLPLWKQRVGRSERCRDRGELWSKLAVA